MISQSFCNGFWMSLIAGLMTGVGGFCIFFKRRYLKSQVDMLLTLTAGIMLSVSVFSLLMPSFQVMTVENNDIYMLALKYTSAIFFGVFIILLLNIYVPHDHGAMGHNNGNFNIHKAWLFIIAITMHKIPEGLAMGVSFGAEDIINPMSLVIGISAHNIPEGLTIAIALICAGYSRIKAAISALLIGAIQPVGAVAGMYLVSISSSVITYGLAMAGGTLLFVVINEILPETYVHKKFSKGLLVALGFMVMTFISIIFKE